MLIPLIIGEVVFAWWAGWTREVWRTPAAFQMRPRRWWMLAFPVLLIVQCVILLAGAPWGTWNAGLPLGFIAFQVAITAATGAVLYGVFRATGRLWVAMVLHGLNDFGLRVSSDDLTARSADSLNPEP